MPGKETGSNERPGSEVPAAFVAPREGVRPDGHRADDGVPALPIVLGVVTQLRLTAANVPAGRADSKVHGAAALLTSGRARCAARRRDMRTRMRRSFGAHVGLLPIRHQRHTPPAHASRTSVTGPSLTSSTSMCSRNAPVWTRAPSDVSASAKASTRSSATSGAAALIHEGRRPRLVSP